MKLLNVFRVQTVKPIENPYLNSRKQKSEERVKFQTVNAKLMCKSIKVLFEMLQSCVVLIVSSLLSLRWNDDMFSGVMTANKEC